MVWNAYSTLKLNAACGAKDIERAAEALSPAKQFQMMVDDLQRGAIECAVFGERLLELVQRLLALRMLMSDESRVEHDRLLKEAEREGRVVRGKPASKKSGKVERAAAHMSDEVFQQQVEALTAWVQRGKWFEFARFSSVAGSGNAAECSRRVLAGFTVEMIQEMIQDVDGPTFSVDAPGWLSRWEAAEELGGVQSIDEAAMAAARAAVPKFRRRRRKSAPDGEVDAVELHGELVKRAVQHGDLMLFNELMSIDRIHRVDYWQQRLMTIPEMPVAGAILSVRGDLQADRAMLLDKLAWNACRLGKTAVAAAAWKNLGVLDAYIFLLLDRAFQSLAGGEYDLAATLLVVVSGLENPLGPRPEEHGPRLHYRCLQPDTACITRESDEVIAVVGLELLLGGPVWRSRFAGLPHEMLRRLLEAVLNLVDGSFQMFEDRFAELAARGREVIANNDIENPGFRQFPPELLDFQWALLGDLEGIYDQRPPVKDTLREEAVESLISEDASAVNKKELELSAYQVLSVVAARHPLVVLLVCLSHFRDHIFLVPARDRLFNTPLGEDRRGTLLEEPSRGRVAATGE
ncbi:hypothetical protein JW905_11200 [bacterium]|nr:hypothetical protein [candidate division CSSED10-310 bacterium]